MRKIKDSLKSNIRINWKSLKDSVVVEIVEIVAIFILSFSFGYLLDSKDPLLINSHGFIYFYMLVLILTLFYGMNAGISLLILLAISDFIYLKEFPQIFFLNGLMLSLIAGEFHYYWIRKIEAQMTETDYLKQKLREIGIAASTIKISHDILEKGYISKPYSIRSVLTELINKKSIEDFLKFISNQFFLDSFLFIEYDPEKMKINKVYPYNTNKENVDLNEPILEKMFFLKEIVYLKDLTDLDRNVKYIAAIPILDTLQRIQAFFLIERMPFIHYNTESLLSVQVISQYFLWNIYKQKIKNVDKVVSIDIPEDKKYELSKLYKLNQSSNVNSSIVLLKVKKKYSPIMDNFLRQSLRALDFYTKINDDKDDIFFVVLPLVAKEGGWGFVNRVFNEFGFLEKQNRYFVFEIRDIDKVSEILKDLSQNDRI